MSDHDTETYVRRDLAAIPPIAWVLAAVVLLLAAMACGLWAMTALGGRLFPAGPSPTPIIWTVTPVPTTVPSAVPTDMPAPTPTISPEIAVGRYVRVTGTEGAGVSLRQDPDVGSPRLGIGYEDEVFVAIDGPREVGGYTWWLVRDPDDEAQRGWVVANYLEPVDHP